MPSQADLQRAKLLLDLGLTESTASIADLQQQLDSGSNYQDKRFGVFSSLFKPVGVVAETFPRGLAGQGTIVGALTSGRVAGSSVVLNKNDVVTSITYYSTSTAAVGYANKWAGLCDKNGIVKTISDDDLANAWPINTAKTFAMSVPYTVPTTDVYYVFIMVNASTTPSLVINGGLSTNTMAQLPYPCWFDAGGRTVPLNVGDNIGIQVPTSAAPPTRPYATIQ